MRTEDEKHSRYHLFLRNPHGSRLIGLGKSPACFTVGPRHGFSSIERLPCCSRSVFGSALQSASHRTAALSTSVIGPTCLRSMHYKNIETILSLSEKKSSVFKRKSGRTRRDSVRPSGDHSPSVSPAFMASMKIASSGSDKGNQTTVSLSVTHCPSSL